MHMICSMQYKFYHQLVISKKNSARKMEINNTSVGVQEKKADSYAMETLISDHHVVLFCVCLFSLILGFILTSNVLWNLKVRFSHS